MLDLIRRVRQNHALEHATMHVLSRRNPYLTLMGRSTPSGFVLYGDVAAQEIANAATEALALLQQGQEHLAVHPRCGTNLAVTSILFRRGHRIRIDISSSNFPRIDRNMNTGNAFGQDAEGMPAVQTIYHQSDYASYIDLPIIPTAR